MKKTTNKALHRRMLVILLKRWPCSHPISSVRWPAVPTSAARNPTCTASARNRRTRARRRNSRRRSSTRGRRVRAASAGCSRVTLSGPGCWSVTHLADYCATVVRAPWHMVQSAVPALDLLDRHTGACSASARQGIARCRSSFCTRPCIRARGLAVSLHSARKRRVVSGIGGIREVANRICHPQ